MKSKTNAMTRSRDIGLNGPGKGDKNRTNDTKAFNANFAEIKWPEVFIWDNHKGGKLIKKYGNNNNS